MIATVPNTSYYHIGYTASNIGTYYLQPTTTTGETLKYLQANNSDLAKWELCPVGDFEVVEMEYFKPAENFLTQNDQRIDAAIIDNQLETQSTYHFVATGAYQESSNFSETEGVRIQVSESQRVGLPVFGMDLSISVSKEKKWTFGNSESKTITVQHGVDVFIPAYSKVLVEAFKQSYIASLRYVATLKQISTGKIFRVKGMWDGVTTSEIYIKTSKLSTADLRPGFQIAEENIIKIEDINHLDTFK